MANQRLLQRHVPSVQFPVDRIYVEGFNEEAVEDPRLRRGSVLEPPDEVYLTFLKYEQPQDASDPFLEINVDKELRKEFSPELSTRNRTVGEVPQEFQLRVRTQQGQEQPREAPDQEERPPATARLQPAEAAAGQHPGEAAAAQHPAEAATGLVPQLPLPAAAGTRKERDPFQWPLEGDDEGMDFELPNVGDLTEFDHFEELPLVSPAIPRLPDLPRLPQVPDLPVEPTETGAVPAFIQIRKLKGIQELTPEDTPEREGGEVSEVH